MKTEISTYEQQAIDFLNATNTSITFKFKKHAPHFIGEKESRDIWRVKIKNKLWSFSFDFGQSISNVGKQPSAYDILACLTKNDPEDFHWFCSNFGYNQYDENTGKENRTAKRIYNSVCKEWANVSKLFSEDQIEQLQEIQ
jgi:hypothetical protein